jgi:hypothetical protein
MIKLEVQLRIRVLRPVEGVTMRVQRGRDELLLPAAESKSELVFEFPVRVNISAETPNFLGPYAQGPKDARFIYVNSGRQAGQGDTCWDRRAKISLMNITKTQVEEVIVSTNRFLEVSFNGTGTDGGPTCASVKGIVWKVAKK